MRFDDLYKEFKKAIAEDNTKAALEALKTALNWHDWYYEYSDDHSIWQRGCRERDVIRYMRRDLKEHGIQDGEDIYNKTVEQKFP